MMKCIFLILKALNQMFNSLYIPITKLLCFGKESTETHKNLA